jgi:hypothetical protein
MPVLFLIGVWLIIPWMAAFTPLPFHWFLLLLTPVLVVIADFVLP